MILLVHIILGALIGQKISNPFLAIILAFFSHYFLDFLPHIEYPTEYNTKKQWRISVWKIVADFCLGFLLVLLLSKNYPIIYVCAFFAILPDCFYIVCNLAPNKIFETHNWLHKKIHFLEDKKISVFWRIFTQVAVVIFCLIFFKI